MPILFRICVAVVGDVAILSMKVVDTFSFGAYTGVAWGKVVEQSKLFLGQFEHAVDDKSRLFVPSRFRAKETVPFILTQGLEQCLFLFPPEGWGRLAEKLNTLPLKDKSEERAFKRLLLAGASEVNVDTQGRILIPEMLRAYADIKREAVILGMLHHVEIWSKERWLRYQKNAQTSFNRVAPHLEL